MGWSVVIVAGGWSAVGVVVGGGRWLVVGCCWWDWWCWQCWMVVGSWLLAVGGRLSVVGGGGGWWSVVVVGGGWSLLGL